MNSSRITQEFTREREPQHMVPSPIQQQGWQGEVANGSVQVQGLTQLRSIANGEPVAQRQVAPQGGLPSQLKQGIEGLSGIAMDDVRVHYNSSKPAQLQAHAYAQGTEIHVAPGQERHLAHEAWHVVQQKQGRVKPTLQLKGVAINDDDGLEREADVMGARALGGFPAQRMAVLNAGGMGDEAPVQRVLFDAKDAAWSYDDVMAVYSADIDTPMKKERLKSFVTSLDGFDVKEVVDAVKAGGAPKIKFPKVNDVGMLDKGCTVCVVADYLGKTVKTLLTEIGVGKDNDLKAAAMKIFRVQGGPDELMALLKGLGISWDIQSFSNWADAKADLATTEAQYDYNGAVAWEGHIIRIKGSGSVYTLWDPQSSLRNVVPPANTAIKILYFGK